LVLKKEKTLGSKKIGAALWIGKRGKGPCEEKVEFINVYSVTPWCLVWKVWRVKTER
jgi:hypothetical protein